MHKKCTAFACSISDIVFDLLHSLDFMSSYNFLCPLPCKLEKVLLITVV